MFKVIIERPALFSLIILMMLSLLNPAYAQPATSLSPTEIQQYWLEDADSSLTTDSALQQLLAGKGQTIGVESFNLGSTDTHGWLLLSVNNQSSQTVYRRLLVGAPYRALLTVYLITENQAIILNESDRRPFSQRNNNFRLLNSEPLSLAANRSSHILIRYEIRGASFLPLSLVSEAEFNHIVLTDSVFAALFYGMNVMIGLVFLLLCLAMKHRISQLYAVQFLLGLLLLASIDGHAFHWLWPQWPLWNNYSPLVILLSLNALGFYIAAQLHASANSPAKPYFRFITTGLIISCVVAIALIPLLPMTPLIGVASTALLIVFGLQLLAFSRWIHRAQSNQSKRSTIISAYLLLLICLVVAVLAGLFFIAGELPDWVHQHSHHLSYLIISLAFMSVLTVHLNGLRKDYEAGLKRELALAKRDAELNRALFESEQKYTTVRQLAEQRKNRLATASHDIRQPLSSLRATLDAITRDQPTAIRQQLSDAFGYIEQLCQQHLQETRPQQQSKNDSEAPYSVSLILKTVQQMFQEEATKHGIKLQVVNCEQMIQQPALIVMRIISNLVSNALKHSGGSKVLLGCLRRENTLQLLVYDNGVGMCESELEALSQAHHKGVDSEGEGLGLSIVQQLATQHQLQLRIVSKHGRGTRFILVLERVKPQVSSTEQQALDQD